MQVAGLNGCELVRIMRITSAQSVPVWSGTR